MITALAFLFDGLVLGIFSYKMFRLFQKGSNPFMFYFTAVTTLIGANFIVYAFLIFLAIYLRDPKVLFWADYFGRALVYIGSVFAIQIPLYQLIPKNKLRYLGSVFVFVLGAALAITNLFWQNQPYIDNLGIVHWQAPIWLGLGLAIMALGIWVPTGIIFLHEFISSKYKLHRSLYLGLGFCIGSIGAGMQDFGTTVNSYILINLLLVLGYVFIFVGVIAKDGK